MKIADITNYLITKEREGFTGAVTLNFYKGEITKKVLKETEEIEEK